MTSTAAAAAAERIPAVHPPWTLKGDTYFFPFWTSQARADNLPFMTYSPLEAASPFADPSISKPVGGLSMVQIIRYRESPVGPYDEFILIPGYFEYIKDDNKHTQQSDDIDDDDDDDDGQDSAAEPMRKKKKGIKITRIYVSQKHSCYNGRRNWNVPKHLARFTWTTNKDKSLTVQVFPQDTHPTYLAACTSNPSASSSSQIPPPSIPPESDFSPIPFFQATFKPIPYAPSFPFTTTWLPYLGINPLLCQPPLPEGRASQDELPGTTRWFSVMPRQQSKRCQLGWLDLRQATPGERDDADAPSDPKGGGKSNSTKDAPPPAAGTKTRHDSHKFGSQGGFENFWPDLSRWQIAIKMEDCITTFDHVQDAWDAPKSYL